MAFYFIWGIVVLVVGVYISTVVSVWRESPSHWPELVVVSVIIAILSIILLPVIDEARKAPAKAAHREAMRVWRRAHPHSTPPHWK